MINYQLLIQLQQSGIILSLKKNGKIYKEKVENADKILEGLDKLLKRSKIESVDSIRDIRVECSKNIGVTSLRIVKVIVRGLKSTRRQLN